MMLGRFGRKKARATSGFHGIGQDSTPQPRGPRLQWAIWPVAFVILVAVITKRPPAPALPADQDIDSQFVAQDTIRAGDRAFETENLEATRKKRDEAAAGVPDTYGVDSGRVRAQRDRLDQRVEAVAESREALDTAIREALVASTSDDAEADVVARAVADFAAELRADPAFEGFPDASFLAVWLMPSMASIPTRVFAEALPAEEDDAPLDIPLAVIELGEPEVTPIAFANADRLAGLAKDGLDFVLSHGIIKPGTFSKDDDRRIVVVREPLADQKVTEEFAVGDVPTPAEAEDLLRERIVEQAKQVASDAPSERADWGALQGAAFEMAKLGMTDTLFFNLVDTKGARERARAAVEPVMKEVRQGEVIVRTGDPWTEQKRFDAKAYWESLETGPKPAARIAASLVAHMIFVGLALGFLSKSADVLTTKLQDKAGGPSSDTFRNQTLALLLMCAALIIGRIVYYFDDSGFVLPVASVAILLAILVHARFAAVASFLTVALVSIQYGYDWRLLAIGFAMSLAGLSSIFKVRRRSDMTRAALHATVVGLLVMVAVTLAMDSLFTGATLRRFALIGMNGAICLLIVPGLLAPLERLFGITTDIQLLEYSDLNNEVLSRLAIEVPATYAHGLMLGQIAEAAADAIGANGLLARVCAYYHDIGKMRRPEYFSENQTGTNIHDELSPRLSGRAIAAHVTQGVEIAREFHLPKPIIDGIREHHGTSLIGFFYQHALEQQKHGDVQEEDFRYPGPKPQSRETAILMVCDAVESGVRSIKNPNEERVHEFVDKIIAGRSADRQFDDCHLTLKELDIIGDVVASRVLSMSHTRVAYPDASGEEKGVSNVIPLSGGAE